MRRGLFGIVQQAREELDEHVRRDALFSHHRAKGPLALTADNILSLKRVPVAGTTGVLPLGAQVVPEWQSERIPDSSPQKMAALTTFAIAWIRGYSESVQLTSMRLSC